MLNSSKILMGSATLLLVAGSVLMVKELTPREPVSVAPAPVPLTPLPAPPPAEARPRMLVALREIPRGAMIQAEALTTIEVVAQPGAEVLRAAEDAVGRVALERIVPGQTLLSSVISANPTAAGLGPLVPRNHRATTLRLAEDTGVSFLLKPGDHVDVMLVTRDDPEPGQPRDNARPPDLARLVLQDVLLLAVGDQLGAEPAQPQTTQGGRPPAPLRTATLAVTPEQLMLLGLARGDGGYMLALRNPEDRDVVPPVRTARSELLGEVEAPPMPAAQPERRVAPVRSGPEILRGPSSSSPQRGAR
ncbi:Flp pilus assembly protein CpaB [Rhodovarius crocodyli]|uniref:Flp pilus assembly protein CpaB n=1 Tax=Rhodovarius crocodyli TaxID=1979269 RepID=A0A437M1Y0_9PROT|nr:Flp pilus assembly protein CpaB [Rhodovarius crocodyli]RVT91553.1 Flp pilus assembly protein CpaB [Rhodovarius crocodyli]